MRKIDYNISSTKSVDLRYFIGTTVTVVLLSVLFIFFGIRKISSTNTNLREKVNQMKYFDRELAQIRDNEKKFEEKIEKIREIWSRKIRFANTMIKHKTFPFLQWLNYFEGILPDMVQINDIRIDNASKGDVVLTVSSYSTEKLYEFYRKLIGNNLVISSESENGGVFKARLKVTMKR